MLSIKNLNLLKANHLLAALPPAESEILISGLEPIKLAQGQRIYTTNQPAQYAYFILTGIVSLLCSDGGGEYIEIGMVGNEGFIGVPIILGHNRPPYYATVHLPTTTLRIRADLLRTSFNSCQRLQDLLLHYTYVRLMQVSQSALCNRFHNVLQRLCRWLLVARDRTKSDVLEFTQEVLSHMLAAPRTGVTMAAGVLQKAGIISYSRGKITILDAERLCHEACECYEVVTTHVKEYLGEMSKKTLIT